MRYLMVLTLVAVALTGCGVSKQIVAEKDAALESCNTNLAACEEKLATAQSRVARLEGDLTDSKKSGSDLRAQLDQSGSARSKLEADLAAAKKDLAAAKSDLSACRGEQEEIRRSIADIEAKGDELRSKLQSEIAELKVDIQTCKDKLAIRVIDSILFHSGSADILPEGAGVLDKIASTLAGGTVRIRVEGHTDDKSIGPQLKEKYFSNWELSAARASSVVRFFEYKHKLDPKRMEAVGLSMFRPVAPNDSPENRQKNRRVEIVLGGS